MKGSFPMRLDHLQRLQFVSLERFSGDQASSSSSSWIKPQNSKRKLNEGECMEAVNEIGFPIICKSKCYDEAEKEAEKSQEYIGYCYTDKTPAEVHRSTTGENKLIGLSTASVKTLSDQYFCLSYPIDVVSHRDGVYECSRDGKPSLSLFRVLGYCAATDTSLVECRPYTGRTHQLRLHLQLLGNPIANDPCYGGKLFFDDPERKMRALRLLHDMKQQGIVPLSKVPHLDDEEIDSFIDSSMNKPTISSNDSAVTNVGAQTKLDLTDQKEGETDHDFLIRTCR